MQKNDVIKGIIEKLHKGAKVEDVKEEFKQHFENVSTADIAEAERALILSGMPVEEVQRLCDVHATLFECSIEDKSDDHEMGHPLAIFKEENKGLREFLQGDFSKALEDYKRDAKEGKPAMLSALKSLSKIDKHYSRKENLFFPYLEKAEITAPPKVMWGVDDEIRDLIKSAITKVEEDQVEASIENIKEALDKVESMITKEEEILIPLLIHNMEEEDWRLVAKESSLIGYAFTGNMEGASPSDAMAWLKKGVASPEKRNDDPIQLPSGHFKESELEAMQNSLPYDISFVGKEGKVQYFNETKDRIFPRTRTVIGRDVSDCHPPKSLDKVHSLIESFKSGKKDKESFWIQRGGKFVLIRYFAVRDEEGNYLGILETTEEISELRKLEGEKTLLS